MIKFTGNNDDLMMNQITDRSVSF